jgi:hypothetical protein
MSKSEDFLVDRLQLGVDRNHARLLEIVDELKAMVISGKGSDMAIGCYFGEYHARITAMINTQHTLSEHGAAKALLDQAKESDEHNS